jgi:putative flippase GtrA
MSEGARGRDGSGARGLIGAAWRFGVAGGFNTVVTAAALTGLSLVIDPRIAYAIVFAAGIGLSVFLADRFVYGVKMSRGDMAAYAVLYVATFGIGLGCLQVMRTWGWPDFASGAVVLVTAPLTFVGGLIITRRRARQRRERGELGGK